MPNAFPILVITHSWSDESNDYDDFESQKIIDHANASDRKWLGNHCYWAMRNSRSVTTHPVRTEHMERFPEIYRVTDKSI